MASVMQGDAYSIPVTIKSGNGTLITPEIAACVEITVGQFAKRWPGQVTFDEKTGEWKFPMTQNQTFRFTPGAAVVQARVVFQDGSIMGGSGAPMRVEQSASRGTLPQPEKAETTTGSTPKATEVTIPTVHDINVFLHSQVILSDPIKAPYIGDNGNWYEYDAATGEFVDTGVKAGGSADLSLGITGAQVGKIAKITAVDTDGKPTKWEPVDIPSGGTDISLGLTAATVGQTIKVKAVDTEGKPTEWEAVDAPSGGGAVDDVQINGNSIVGANRVAEIPKLNMSPLNNPSYGLPTLSDGNTPVGIGLHLKGSLMTIPAKRADITNRKERDYFDIGSTGSDFHFPICPGYLDYSVKAAMCDGKGAAWTDVERLAALLRMGCTVDDNGFVKWTAQEVTE